MVTIHMIGFQQLLSHISSETWEEGERIPGPMLCIGRRMSNGQRGNG